MAVQAVEMFRKRVAYIRQRARRARELERRRMRRMEQRAGNRGAAQPEDEVLAGKFLWCLTLTTSSERCRHSHGLKRDAVRSSASAPNELFPAHVASCWCLNPLTWCCIPFMRLDRLKPLHEAV